MTDNIIRALGCIMMAIFGVSAKELSDKEIKEVKLGALAAKMFVVSFGAVIVYIVTLLVPHIHPAVGLLTAAGIGWGGVEAVNRYVQKNVGLDSELKEIKKDNNTDSQ